jgi:hypothetical protein
MCLLKNLHFAHTLFRVILRRNDISLYNVNMFVLVIEKHGFLWGRNWIFIQSLDKLHLRRGDGAAGT